MPRFFSSLASWTVSSGVQPPSTQSVAETRMPSGFCSGQTARTASYISMAKRMRFSLEPPYSSVRLLESGDKN